MRAGSLTWKGVAMTLDASSETASSAPLRSRIRPAQAGHGDRLGLLIAGLGGECAALHSLEPERRARTIEKQRKKAAKSSPIRRSTSRIPAPRPAA